MVDKVKIREVKTVKVMMGARGLPGTGGGGTAQSTRDQIDAFSVELGSTEWLGADRDPATAGFQMSTLSGDAPFVTTLTDQSVVGDTPIITRVLSFSDSRPDVTLKDPYTHIITVTEVSASLTITLTVTDDAGLISTAQQTITTTAFVANVPPVLFDQNLFGEVNTPLIVTMGTLLDGDGEVLDYSRLGDVADTVDGASENTFTINSATAGVKTINVSATDGEDTATSVISITINEVQANSTPVINKPSDVYVASNGTMNVQPELGNPQSAGLVKWSLTGSHDDIKIDSRTGAISWDTSLLTASESFHITIKCSNAGGDGYVVFIAHVGKTTNDVIYIGPGKVITNWKAAYDSGLVAGMTIVFSDGDWTGPENEIGRTVGQQNQYPPSGTPTAYTCVMGTTPTKTKYTSSLCKIKFDLWAAGVNEKSYITFSGFHFETGSAMALVGDSSDKLNTRVSHIKVLNCGGDGEDNVVIYARIADYILYEGCYSYGGGRYKLQFNEATNSIMRRCIARYDRSDNSVDEKPKGSFVPYNTMYFRLDNCLALDDLEAWRASGYIVAAFGTPVTFTSVTETGAYGVIESCMQVNSEQRVTQFDYQSGGISDVQVRNLVSYDVRPDQFYAYNWGYGKFDRCTFAKVECRYDSTYGMINTGGYNNFGGIQDSIIHDIQFAAGGQYLVRNVSVGSIDMDYGGDVYRTADKVGILNNNLTEFGGTRLVNSGTLALGTTAVDIVPDFKYLTRLEDSSTLSETKGAVVMTLHGRSGTFYGEPGFDVDTKLPMWPYPNEEMFRQVMNAYTYTGPTFLGSDYLNRTTGPVATIDGTRGCAAAGGSITDYIWGYLGNTVPPMGVAFENADASVHLNWLPPVANATPTITGFTVYDYDINTKVLSNPRAVAASTYNLTVTGLNNGFDAYFVVTATDSVMGESGYSYFVKARANGVATQLPLIQVQPSPVTVVEGAAATFEVTGQGYNTLRWQMAGVDIPGGTGRILTFTPLLVDHGKAITVILDNDVGPVTSAPVTISVVELDLISPVVSISLTDNNLTLTLSDNQYPNAEVAIQVIVDGIDTGGVRDGSNLVIDLSTVGMSVGNHNVQVRATDPQTNTSTSNTVVYAEGSTIYTDYFEDTSKWDSPGMTVAAGVASLSQDSSTTTNIWNANSACRLKFDMKVLDAHNNTAYTDLIIGGSLTGDKYQGALRLRFKDRQDRSVAVMQYNATGDLLTGPTGTAITGFGNSTSSPGSGSEVWKTYEIIVIGTSLTVFIDGTPSGDLVLSASYTPVTGAIEFDMASIGTDTLQLRNLEVFA